ncbi:MAG: hypothetical protein ACI9D8_000474 [Reinekea sp.]|jgi:hypothetical protein|tara:strand:- start:76 stop:255 length:180 start_codon:yes stop_codon:yes gene_type:complete
MLPIVQILLVLGVVMALVLFITSRNPTKVSAEQQASYSKWFRILVPIMLIAAAIKYFIG